MHSSPPDADVLRLGAVSYLNTLPLIEGLGKLSGVALTLTAPSDLIDLLMRSDVDLALASVIDAARHADRVVLVPAGMIGSAEKTLSVRLFSRLPLERVTDVAADIESHTSVALLRVLMAERFRTAPTIRNIDASSLPGEGAGADVWPEALLLIGDKAVAHAPPEAIYPHHMDLGEAWRALTGLPFVYAVWMARREDAFSPLLRAAFDVLDRQRRHNATRLDWIASSRAATRGWTPALASHYLRDLLRYDVTDESREAVLRFFALCATHGVLTQPCEPVWIR